MDISTNYNRDLSAAAGGKNREVPTVIYHSEKRLTVRFMQKQHNCYGNKLRICSSAMAKVAIIVWNILEIQF